jgi:uncharacterized BrkB/YihY/UPF0761 family membrane protein
MAKTNKRKTRIFILSVCILLVLIAAVAFFGHQLLFNNLDQDEKAAIDDEVGKITQSIVEEILNSDTDYFSETAGTDSGRICVCQSIIFAIFFVIVVMLVFSVTAAPFTLVHLII